MNNPQISVIIPSYNHCKYIGQAIESVLTQSFEDFELLIADDCSSDNSREIIGNYSDKRIKTFFLEKNLGAVPILEFLINESSCEYIALLNSDDYWLPEKLEKQYRIMQDNTGLGACFTWADIVNEDNKTLNAHEYMDMFKQRNKNQGKWLQHFFFNSNCLCHPSILIKKSIFREIGFYKHYLRQFPDYEMWIRLIKLYPIHIVEESLVAHRIHLLDNENSSAETLENAIRVRNELYLVYRSFFDDMEDSVFVEGFFENFVNKKASSHEELSCEQAFLLLNNPLRNNVMTCIALEKLAELLQNEKTRQILLVSYSFTHSDYFRLTSKKGIGYLDINANSNVRNINKIVNFFQEHKQLYKFLKDSYKLLKRVTRRI